MGEKKRGFGSMDPAKQKAIASLGGKAAHEAGTAHEWTSEEAAAAGRKGGLKVHKEGKGHKFTSEEAREAGRKGGRAKGISTISKEGENRGEGSEAEGVRPSGGDAGGHGDADRPDAVHGA